MLALSQALTAEQFFVRNRPFQPVEKREGVWMAPLSALAPALNLPLTQLGSRWIVGAPPEELSETEPGAYYQGRRLQSVGPDLQVNVQAFMHEIGGRYIVNKSLGSVDLYAPTKMLSRAMSCSNVHVLIFQRADSNGQDFASLSDSLRTTRGLEPIAINFEDSTHPLWQQWGKYWAPGAMPLVVLVDPSGRILGRWSTKLPPASELQQTFGKFVAQRSSTNAQQVAMPATGSSGGLSSGSSGG